MEPRQFRLFRCREDIGIALCGIDYCRIDEMGFARNKITWVTVRVFTAAWAAEYVRREE